MLTRIELEVLATVERGDIISDIAGKLGHSESHISRAVADLSEKGLVYVERDGRRKRVIPSDARAVEVYRDLVRQHTHIDFHALLTGKSFEVLYHLDGPLTVSELAEASDNYRNTVNRILKRLGNSGLVGTDDGSYSFNGDFDRLHEFARELAHHRHRQRLESVAPNGTILWESDDEFLAQTETEIDDAAFHETGLVRFAAYDLQFLLTSRQYYFYSAENESVRPPDLCCHTLLIDDDTRNRSYCLLLLTQVDVADGELRERSRKYGLEDEIEALIRYLETDGDVQDDRLPAWHEFQELAADYNVTIPA